MMNNVKELELHLMELNDSVKNLVTNGIEATELHILLSEIDKTVTRGKECIVRENCCYAEAFRNIENLAREKEHNDEYSSLYTIARFFTPVRKIQEPFYTKAEFDKLAQNIKNIQEVYKVDTKIRYELEFKEEKIGSYNIYFGDNNYAHIDIFKPNKIYKNSRIVKTLIEDTESYIESFNLSKGYIIIRNDRLDKFVIFTRIKSDDYYYIEPEEYCKDTDRV